MNILFVFERKIIPHKGGVERVTSLLAQEFIKRGHNVSYLSVGPRDWNQLPEQNESEKSEGIKQSYIPSGEEGFCNKIDEFLNECNPDIAIVQGHHASVIPVLPLLKGRVWTMMVFHNQPFPLLGIERYVKLATPWKSLQFKGKMLKSLAIGAPSVFRKYYTRNQARKYTCFVNSVDKFVLLSKLFIPRLLRSAPFINQEKLLAVNNPNTFSIPEKMPEEKENIVLVVTRLSNPQKNITGFIEVWAEFSRRHPDWKALIVGDGEHSAWLKAYVRKKGVTNLSFEGSRESVADYYSRAKILCMTSAYEGWPMVLAEGMAYGCVPVAYDSFEAVHEIIDSGKTGYLIPPFSRKEMVAAMGTIADNDESRLRMAEAARNSVQRFSVKKIAGIWEEIFQLYRWRQ